MMEMPKMCNLSRVKPITTSVRLRRRRDDQPKPRLEDNRHSADMDYGGRRPLAGRRINNSAEWEDDGFTTEALPPIHRNNPVTNFHVTVSKPSMQTLDRRISASSDQLDTLKKLDGFREKRPARTRSSSRYLYERKTHEQDDVVFQYKGERYSKNQYFFGDGEARRKISRESESKKTPYEMFLEDDGPYSRKLYGPVDGPMEAKRTVPSVSSGGYSGLGGQLDKYSGHGGQVDKYSGHGVPVDKYSGHGVQMEKPTFKNILAKSHDNITENPVPVVRKTNIQMDFHTSEPMMEEDAAAEPEEDEPKAVKKGLLWQQRDRLFSRWKERYFVLTRDYIHCFKKASSKITEMGGYIFKVKLMEIDTVDLLDKRGYLTICISQLKDGRIYLRKPEGIRDWYNMIQCNVYESKKRRKFWVRSSGADSNSIEQWLLARQKIGSQYNMMSESTPNIATEEEEVPEDPEDTVQATNVALVGKRQEECGHNPPRGINRLSLVSDLLMSEAISDYTHSTKIEEKNEDSGNDSGHNSMNTTDSQSDNNSSPEDIPVPLKSKLDTPDLVKINVQEKQAPPHRYKDSSSFHTSQRKPIFRRSYAFGQIMPVTQV